MVTFLLIILMYVCGIITVGMGGYVAIVGSFGVSGGIIGCAGAAVFVIAVACSTQSHGGSEPPLTWSPTNWILPAVAEKTDGRGIARLRRSRRREPGVTVYEKRS